MPAMIEYLRDLGPDVFVAAYQQAHGSGEMRDHETARNINSQLGILGDRVNANAVKEYRLELANADPEKWGWLKARNPKKPEPVRQEVFEAMAVDPAILQKIMERLAKINDMLIRIDAKCDATLHRVRTLNLAQSIHDEIENDTDPDGDHA